MAARTDNVTDKALAAQLLLARRGQAYFSRKLRELRDGEFDAPSRLPGWSRRTLVAHVGLNARALTNLTRWAATGVETPMYESLPQRDWDIEFASTLPVTALRHLSDHAAVHLNVEWRDLGEDAWSHTVRTALGREVPVSETVWMRTREVWIHAVDLGNGGRFEDFPPDLIDRVLEDLVQAWRRRRSTIEVPSIVLTPTDRNVAVRGGDVEGNEVVVLGTAARLAAWGTGRSTRGVHRVDGLPLEAASQWL